MATPRNPQAAKDRGGLAALKILGFVLILILMGGIAIYLYSITIVKWWIPVVVASVISLGLWWIVNPIWVRALPEIPAIGRFVIHILTVTIFLTGAVLGANRLGARHDSVEDLTATITKKYQEKRYHSRRVGRGRYVKGEHYYVYFIVLTLPDGKEKTQEVNPDTYIHTAINSEMQLKIATGLLFWPVILNNPITQ